MVQTAVDGIGAACGRATMRDGADGRLQEVARAGEPEVFGRALHAAEAAVIDAGQLAEIQIGGASALAAPLGANEEGDQVVGIVSVARGDRAFTHGERELFAYLTNQASVSVENVDLHETVQRQAVTDELTGLFNHRRFQEVMAVEVERARRYGHEMGLIMLDIDDFKQVNDTYGHLQGDLVLREVARVLRLSSREIDEPARYGGEEMAVALPQTDLEGAFQFAERVRKAVEALEFPVPSGASMLRVTASFGVASLAAADHADKDALVAAADAALYQAKRSGKNRTERANGPGRRRRGVHGVVSGGVACRAEAWDCSTTQSASTLSSSASTARIQRRSRGRRTRPSVPRAGRSSRARARPPRGGRGRPEPVPRRAGRAGAGRRGARRADRATPSRPSRTSSRRPSRSPRSRRAAEPAPREPFDVEAVEPSRRPPSRPPRRRAWLDDEPDEVPADEALDRPRPAGDEDAREDVLEETPDFLQETPEHDRLWFEQRPPRDFDWDK